MSPLEGKVRRLTRILKQTFLRQVDLVDAESLQMAHKASQAIFQTLDFDSTSSELNCIEPLYAELSRWIIDHLLLTSTEQDHPLILVELDLLERLCSRLSLLEVTVVQIAVKLACCVSATNTTAMLLLQCTLRLKPILSAVERAMIDRRKKEMQQQHDNGNSSCGTTTPNIRRPTGHWRHLQSKFDEISSQTFSRRSSMALVGVYSTHLSSLARLFARNNP